MVLLSKTFCISILGTDLQENFLFIGQLYIHHLPVYFGPDS